MKTITETKVKLDDKEKKVLASVINHCGSGMHPYADSDMLGGFTVSYASYCIGKAIRDYAPDAKKLKLLAELLIKLNES